MTRYHASLTQAPQTQREFLLDAMEKLALSPGAFAQRVGTPLPTLYSWLQPVTTESGFHEMPDAVWKLVREIVTHDVRTTLTMAS